MLSTLSGSGWLLTEAYPSDIPFPFAGCLHFTLIGCAGLLASLRDRRVRVGPLRIGSIAVAALCLFAVPAAGLALTAGGISAFTSAALFSAIPAMIVVGAAWFGAGPTRELLAPSLIGLFGALLLFPFELPHTSRGILCLLATTACCVSIAAASIWLHAALRGVAIGRAVALAGFSGALLLGGYGTALGWPHLTPRLFAIEALRCAVFDLPVVWLTLWLAREVDPARLSARFLIAPLATILEGYALAGGPLDLRRLAAILLMAGAAAALVLRRNAEAVTGLGLR